MIDGWYVEACKTWNRVLEETVRRYPERTFLVQDDRSLTYAEFHALVSQFARGLLSLGVRKNDVVAIWMTNRIEWVICQFAIYRVGGVLLPLYSYYRKAELDYALRQAGVSTLITADRFLGKINAAEVLTDLLPELRELPKDAFFCDAFPALRTIITLDAEESLPGRYGYREVLTLGAGNGAQELLLAREASISPFDVMNIMYTSGTTGFPKGGMSMHVTNLTTTTLWSRLARLTCDDVILCHVPLFTNFGGLYGAPLGLKNGCKVVLTEQFDAGLSLRLIERHKVTYIPGTPSMFRMLLDHPDLSTCDIGSVRGGHVAGAPLTESTMKDIIEVLGATYIMQAWGMSECGGLSTVSNNTHPFEKRLKSVGIPLESVKVRIVDGDQKTCPPGEAGEIWLGDVHPGSGIGKGYYRMPERTAATITPDGWFRTGDVGYFDAEGFLYIAGRVDDMFTVGGFNVYPAEIENKLEQMPGVQEAFIVPFADRRLVNVPVAWVALDEQASVTEQDVVAFCKANMTPQKTPRRVFFYRPGELPMTPAGKVKKKELTEKTAHVMGAEGNVSEKVRP